MELNGKMVATLYKAYRQISGGAETGNEGTSGSFNPNSLVKVLAALDVKDGSLVDFGAAEGRVLFAALICGANDTQGYELPANRDIHYEIFKHVYDRLDTNPEYEELKKALGTRLNKKKLLWYGKNIDEIQFIPGRPTCAFTFWVSLPIETQKQIIKLCAISPTIRSLAVQLDRSKWGTPGEVLNEFSNYGPNHWRLQETINVRAIGGAAYTCWIFTRSIEVLDDDNPPAPAGDGGANGAQNTVIDLTSDSHTLLEQCLSQLHIRVKKLENTM